ncbi:hypothetical protein ACOI22_03775 [Glaciecola sp. 2405UD65-10]|uniref:hypothetical protein n=1 Tax=Glaciecola sp. 2405UD65-10 TaxID=3397244 RepID=UPI003B596DF2
MKTSLLLLSLSVSINSFAFEGELNAKSTINKEEVIAALQETQKQQITLKDISFANTSFTLSDTDIEGKVIAKASSFKNNAKLTSAQASE